MMPLTPNENTNSEKTELVNYDPRWPGDFEREKQQLLVRLPKHLARRIEHFGSTAIPGIMAKPVIDVLIEVESSDVAKNELPEFLVPLGYEFYWRPTTGDEDTWYCWFIKRNSNGLRSHHLHFVERSSTMWKRLLFTRFLAEHQVVAKEYEQLKLELSKQFPEDRTAYTYGKSNFVERVTNTALKYYREI